jgi:hypothetical protein
MVKSNWQLFTAEARRALKGGWVKNPGEFSVAAEKHPKSHRFRI